MSNEHDTTPSRDDGGPAFAQPWHPEMGWSPREAAPGMTLRDWFAGQALAGILADESAAPSGGWANSETVSSQAYKYADAMLAERGRE